VCGIFYSTVVTADILAKVRSDNSLATIHFFINPTSVVGHSLPTATPCGLSRIYFRVLGSTTSVQDSMVRQGQAKIALTAGAGESEVDATDKANGQGENDADTIQREQE
jgi:hypothetical protein